MSNFLNFVDYVNISCYNNYRLLIYLTIKDNCLKRKVYVRLSTQMN